MLSFKPLADDFHVQLIDPISLPEEEANTLWNTQKEPHHFDGPFVHCINCTDHLLTGCLLPYRFLFAQERGLNLHLRPVTVSGITRNKDMILIGKRSLAVTQHPNAWELVPSGSLDQADFLASLTRELQEEASLTPTTITPLAHVDEPPMLHLLCTITATGAIPTSTKEYSQLLWLTPEQLKELKGPFVPLSEQLIAMLQ